MGTVAESLSFASVRAAISAAEPAWEEVSAHEDLDVISVQRAGSGVVCHLDVYVSSGTILGTVMHPSQGRLEAVRLGVTPDLLRALLGDPQTHLRRGVKLVYGRTPRASLGGGRPDSEEDALAEHIVGLDSELASIAAHCEALKIRLHVRQRERAAAAVVGAGGAACAADYTARGQNLCVFVGEELHAQLAQVPLPSVLRLAIAPHGAGYVFTLRDGDTVWVNARLPAGAARALRARAGKHTRPDVLALGSGGRFFLQFPDGRQRWKAPGFNFADAVRGRDVRSVAFGKTSRSYFVLYEDGTTSWSDIPAKLRKMLTARNGSMPKPEYVGLGPGGEYFVRFEGGATRYGGMGEEAFQTLKRIEGYIREVTFGDNNCFLARFNPY